MPYRAIIFASSTPIPQVMREATLHEDTWDTKITIGHPEMIPHLKDVESTIEKPTTIWESGTTPGNLVFINQAVTDSAGRSLRVAVKPVGLDGEIRSAYFSSNIIPGTIRLWP